MFDLPVWFVGTVLMLLGCIMGSFLDVFISRFHTGRSINGRSHCTSCGHTLDWYELFPVFSYAFLRGRCLVCGGRIPARLFWMEITTGLLFLLVFMSVDTIPALLFGLVFSLLAIIITVYDVRHLVIPNGFVWATALLAASFLVYESYVAQSFTLAVPYVFSAIVAASFYYLLWLISRGRWIGKGDAKLALPLGMMLTAQQTFSFVVLSFWVGAAVSVVLLLMQYLLGRGQSHLRFLRIPLTMKSEVPFAPFLLIAFALVYFWGFDVLKLFSITL